MSWAFRRRFLIIGGVILAIMLIASAWIFLATRQPPSCVDRTQNQKETGVDCGGPCPYLCNTSVTPPRTDFARAVSPIAGRTDVIAYVSNPNTGIAALRAPYTVEIYGAANTLIATRQGVMDLPPSSQLPLFIPNVAQVSGATRAFLEFDANAIRWFRYNDMRVQPRVVRSGYSTAPTPRIDAVVENPGVTALTNITVVATVFDADSTAIAASSTLIPSIPAGGQVPAVFTWNAAWPAMPARIEVEPVIPLAP